MPVANTGQGPLINNLDFVSDNPRSCSFLFRRQDAQRFGRDLGHQQSVEDVLIALRHRGVRSTFGDRRIHPVAEAELQPTVYEPRPLGS